MPKKKTNEKKNEARRLFEKGLSLAKIAKKLDVKPSTLRNWKSRDGKRGDAWGAGRGGGVAKPENRDARKPANRDKQNANLRPPFEPGNKAAVKHGIYADHSKDEGFLELLDEGAGREILDLAHEQILQLRANLVMSQKGMDYSNLDTLQAMARATDAFLRSAGKYLSMERQSQDAESDRMAKLDAIMDRLDEEAKRHGE